MKRCAARLSAIATLSLRFGVSGLLAAAWTAMRPFIASTLETLPVNPLFPVSYSPAGEAWLGIWNRWDGYRYFLLAYSSYAAPSNLANTVFYPLYPMILRGLWKLTGLDLIAISLFVSTLTAFFAFFMLSKLAEDQFGEKTAKYAVVTLAVYPTALFLIGPYTEGLFLGLTLAAFYLARKNRWLLAGLCAALASLTRGPGVLTVLPLAWIAFEQWRKDSFAWSRSLIWKVVGVAAPGIAGLGFLIWRTWMGFPPVNEVLKEYFGVSLVNPFAGIITALRTIFQEPSVPVIIDGITIIAWIVLFVCIFRQSKIIPIEWILFMGINLLVTTSKVTTIISPMQSIGRYVLVLFPGFIFIGGWLAKSKARVRFTYLVASISLLMIFCALYAVGFFIG